MAGTQHSQEKKEPYHQGFQKNKNGECSKGEDT